MKVKGKSKAVKATKVEKQMLVSNPTSAASIDDPVIATQSISGSHRGIDIITSGDSQKRTGINRQGETQSVYEQIPRFILTPEERFDVLKTNSVIFGIISSRMNRIGGLKMKVVPKKNMEEKIVFELKMAKSIYDDYWNYPDLKYKTAAAVMRAELMRKLPTLLPDLSNFDKALVRYKKWITRKKMDRANEIEDWLASPNKMEKWEDHIKKYVADLMLHGSTAVFKNYLNGKPVSRYNYKSALIESVHILPGGSVYPVKNPFVTNMAAYIQNVPGFRSQVMYSDEVMHDIYLPNSMSAYGLVPLDSLLNKLVEIMLQDEYYSNRADGSQPTKKAVIFGRSPDPMSPNSTSTISNPLAEADKRRIEAKLNEVGKSPITVITGTGTPMVMDLSIDEIAAELLARRIEMKKEIAVAFNMTNMEMNEIEEGALGGTGAVEGQAQIEQSKGIYPIVRSAEQNYTDEIIPFRIGDDCYAMQLQSGVSQSEEIAYWRELKDSGLFSTNEVRTEEMNKEPFPDKQYDLPIDMKPTQPMLPGM